MRFGYCMSVGFAKGEPFAEFLFDTVADAGFDYVELPLSGIHTLDSQQFMLLERRLATIPCRACNLFFPPELKIVGSDMDIDGIHKYLGKMLPVAASLGVETLVFGNGGARKIPDGAERADICNNLRTLVGIMEEYAAKQNIVIAVEPLNSLESNVLNSYGEAAGITRGLAFVNTMVDSYHVYMDHQDYADVLDDPGQLRHLHTANPVGRYLPALSDDASLYAPFVAAVKRLGYADKISVEGGIRAAEHVDISNEIAEALLFLTKTFGV